MAKKTKSASGNWIVRNLLLGALFVVLLVWLLVFSVGLERLLYPEKKGQDSHDPSDT